MIALTAVFFRSGEGYVGFVAELPGVNAYARTLAEARATLIDVAAAGPRSSSPARTTSASR